ncbi:hypothetical protein AB8B21_31005 [Tardiphaga sp. 866_E4_N2_1]|uniref:hypothetical protein n=1 Tax=unclassified Tardiphaga TaxID=2631404 RepID=UPI003F2924D6
MFEREDHLIDRRWDDLKEALHVGLGGRVSKHERIGVDETQVFTLLFGEPMNAAAPRGVSPLLNIASGPPANLGVPRFYWRLM